jgi:hypothetical protein
VTHRDEFPTDYSLAGCSPAEPASASSAVFILNQKPIRSPAFYGEPQLFPNSAVSIYRALHRNNLLPMCGPDMLTFGGEGGIRTHVRVSPKHAFQACAFNHSATSPLICASGG